MKETVKTLCIVLLTIVLMVKSYPVPVEETHAACEGRGKFETVQMGGGIVALDTQKGILCSTAKLEPTRPQWIKSLPPCSDMKSPKEVEDILRKHGVIK